MFKVREGLRSWVVDVRASQCACGLWQLSGLPCEHALACITYNRDPIEPYCDPCYMIGTYRLAYGNSINPLNDASQWNASFGPDLRPPTIERPTSGPRQKKGGWKQERWQRRKTRGEKLIRPFEGPVRSKSVHCARK
ncbi:hypothetical protein LINPERHAP2_LOCUS26083 [Linum perenne]